MSEYTPITTDMRLLLGCFTKLTDFERDRSTQVCDAIDAIHAQLERENESLKAELDRVLGEQEDSRSCIYYDAERHYCSCHDIDTDGLVELPKDADGVPIRVGDMMNRNGSRLYDEALFEVRVLRYSELGWEAIDRLGDRYGPSMLRHHQPDTWERIIEDAIDSVDGGQTIAQLVARCKALCERTKEEA